jgi:hypothetical protein
VRYFRLDIKKIDCLLSAKLYLASHKTNRIFDLLNHILVELRRGTNLNVALATFSLGNFSISSYGAIGIVVARKF